MKAFISLRMNGRPSDEIKESFDKALEIVKKELSYDKEKHDKLDLIDTFNHANLPENPQRLHYLGASIQKLADADVVFFYDDWYKAKGCWVEFVAACLYDKAVIFEYPNSFIGWTADSVKKLIKDALIWDATRKEIDNND